MNLQEFSNVNWQRCIDKDGFNDPNIEPEYILLGLTEELGEVAGVLKKLKRGFNKREAKKELERWIKDNNIENNVTPNPGQLAETWRHRLIGKLASECADVLGYLDLFATCKGIDLSTAMKDKFNKVSDEMECPQFKI